MKPFTFSILFLLIFSTYCSTPFVTPKSDEKQEAKATLLQYLYKRSHGDYKECKKFLSKHFLQDFIKKFGSAYLDYYRWENEDYYNNFNILNAIKTKNLISIKIAVEIQGPGYEGEALEEYRMSHEEDHWKIVDYDIEYK
jgi:hypothetical protein